MIDTELEILWAQEKVLVPSFMPRGSLYVFEEPQANPTNRDDPYFGVLACPTCGTPGMVTTWQCAGLLDIICGTEACSEWFTFESKLEGAVIVHRKPV